MKHYGYYDVIVAGGGPAGLSAAIASARQGARTVLIERMGVLGSMATIGLCPNWLTFHDYSGRQIVFGIAQELMDRMERRGKIIGHQRDIRGALYSRTLFDPELFKLVAFELVEEAGVELLMHTMISGVLRNRNTVEGLNVANKEGLGIVLGKVIVDCTGDGDVAAWMGAEVMLEPQEVRQPVSLQFRIGNVRIEALRAYMKAHSNEFVLSIDPDTLHEYPYINNVLNRFPPFLEACQKGEFPEGISMDNFFFWTSGVDIEQGIVYVNATRTTDYNPLSPLELGRAEIQLRKQAWALYRFLKRELPGFEKSYLLDTADLIGVRETRRIRGQYVMTLEDIMNSARFADSVGVAASPVDIHGGKREEGKMRWLKSKEGGVAPYQIPYRILIPKGVSGLLVAGRCVSSTREANGALRLMPVCSITGQAAGTAAALACRLCQPLERLPLDVLQDTLKQAGHRVGID